MDLPALHLTLKMYFIEQNKNSSKYYKMLQYLFSDTQMIYTIYKTFNLILKYLRLMYLTVKPFLL